MKRFHFVKVFHFVTTLESRGAAGTALANTPSMAVGAIPPVATSAVARGASDARRSPRIVPPKRTRVAPAQFRRALGRAYRTVRGKEPSAATLDILTAHVSHETGRGERMFNYNFGGIKGVGPGGLTAKYKTHEYIDGDKVNTVDGFRAYRSIDEGAVDYLALMDKRYGSALDEAARGDVNGFAAALKRRRYYTAPLDGYAKALRGLVGADVRVGEAPKLDAEIGPLPTVELVRTIFEATARAASLANPSEEGDQLKESDKGPFE